MGKEGREGRETTITSLFSFPLAERILCVHFPQLLKTGKVEQGSNIYTSAAPDITGGKTRSCFHNGTTSNQTAASVCTNLIVNSCLDRIPQAAWLHPVGFLASPS